MRCISINYVHLPVFLKNIEYEENICFLRFCADRFAVCDL